MKIWKFFFEGGTMHARFRKHKLGVDLCSFEFYNRVNIIVVVVSSLYVIAWFMFCIDAIVWQASARAKKRREEKQKKVDYTLFFLLGFQIHLGFFFLLFLSTFSRPPRQTPCKSTTAIIFVSFAVALRSTIAFGKRNLSIAFGVREQFSRLHMAKDVRPLSSVRFHCIHFFPKGLLPDGASELPNHLCAYLVISSFPSTPWH